MIFGITTTNHASRQDYFNALLDQVKKLGYETVISVDDGSLGIYQNKKKCWTEALEKAIEKNEDCILAEDDIELSKNFQKYIDMLDGELLFYSLFNRLRGGKIGLIKGELEIYVKPKRGLYEQAIYIPKQNVRTFYEVYKQFWKELKRLQENNPRQQQHPDIMFYTFLMEPLRL